MAVIIGLLAATVNEANMTDVTRQLAAFAVETDYGALPEPVRREGPRAFLNWLGCCLGGARDPAMAAAMAAFAQLGEAPQASVLGRGRRLDMASAALLNCMASSLNAFDDTHLESVIHPTGPVAGALLALAERRPVGGRDFLAALLVGIEVECRVANMLTRPPAECDVGLYMTGIVGGIGAAAGAGRLLGLDCQRMIWALGIAAAQAGGFRELHPTMCLGFVPGNGARSGLMAALLAEQGLTGADTALEGPRGFAHVLAHPPNLEAAVAGLGTQYEVLGNAYKPYPCGIVIHPAIDACLDLAEAHRIAPDAIEHIALEVHPLTLVLCDRPKPNNRNEALVSLYHWVAAAFVDRAAGLAQSRDARVRDPALARIRARTKAQGNERLGRDEVKARVTLADGRVLDAHVAHARGSLQRPMSDSDLEAKFRGQAQGVLAAECLDRLVELCWRIESSADVGGDIRRAVEGRAVEGRAVEG